MSAASLALQSAIFAALCADAGVKSVLGDPARIYDDVPRDAAFPYLVIGDDTEKDWSTATEQGREHMLALHIWSRALGRMESKQIADAAIAVLDNAALTLDGHALVDCFYQGAQFTRQTDGRTYHAILRFRAVTEPL